MVLKPQTMRNWKLATGIACTATGLHAVFNVDYGEQEHVFTGIQAWGNQKKDEFFGIGPNAVAAPSQARSDAGHRVAGGQETSEAMARAIGVGSVRNIPEQVETRRDSTS